MFKLTRPVCSDCGMPAVGLEMTGVFRSMCSAEPATDPCFTYGNAYDTCDEAPLSTDGEDVRVLCTGRHVWWARMIDQEDLPG